MFYAQSTGAIISRRSLKIKKSVVLIVFIIVLLDIEACEEFYLTCLFVFCVFVLYFRFWGVYFLIMSSHIVTHQLELECQECEKKRKNELGYCLLGQCHRSRLIITSSKYDCFCYIIWTNDLVTTKLVLTVDHHKPKWPVKILDCCVQGQCHRLLRLPPSWTCCVTFTVHYIVNK